jgi:hypothetical protein
MAPTECRPPELLRQLMMSDRLSAVFLIFRDFFGFNSQDGQDIAG